MSMQTQTEARELQTEEVIWVAAFRSALRRFLHRTETTARSAGLTPRWYMLLLLVKGAPDRSERTTVTQLVDQLQIAQSSVTELVQRVEAVGLVTRERSPSDHRVAYLRLTDEGERRLAAAFRDLDTERRSLAEALLALFDGGVSRP